MFSLIEPFLSYCGCMFLLLWMCATVGWTCKGYSHKQKLRKKIVCLDLLLMDVMIQRIGWKVEKFYLKSLEWSNYLDVSSAELRSEVNRVSHWSFDLWSSQNRCRAICCFLLRCIFRFIPIKFSIFQYLNYGDYSNMKWSPTIGNGLVYFSDAPHEEYPTI